MGSDGLQSPKRCGPEYLRTVLGNAPEKQVAFFADGRVFTLRGIIDHGDGILITLDRLEFPEADTAPAESEAE